MSGRRDSFGSDEGKSTTLDEESGEIRGSLDFLSYMDKKEDDAKLAKEQRNAQQERIKRFLLGFCCCCTCCFRSFTLCCTRPVRILTVILIVAAVGIGLGMGHGGLLSQEQIDERRQRKDDLREILLPISPGTPLFNTSSHQHEALEWLVDCGPVDNLMLEETYLMALLYYSAGGNEWKHEGLFLKCSYPVCDWNDELDGKGVFCDATKSYITFLILRDMYLEGTLPSELGHLTSLERLNLEDNRISGTMPSEFGNFCNLYHFDVHNNRLTGIFPTELGNMGACGRVDSDAHANVGSENMTRGAHADKNRANATGAVPTESKNVANNSLSLYFSSFANQISGTIPTEFGNMPARTMDLSENPIQGTIPTELGRLSAMSDLDLAQTHLTGPIPTEIGTLTSLQFLRLEKNYLSGTIPTEVGQLTLLNILRLDKNELKGTFPSELNDLTSLTSFNTHRNNIEGSLDSLFCQPSGVGNVYVPFTNTSFKNLNTIRADTYCDGETRNIAKVACACCCCNCGMESTDKRHVDYIKEKEKEFVESENFTEC